MGMSVIGMGVSYLTRACGPGSCANGASGFARASSRPSGLLSNRFDSQIAKRCARRAEVLTR